jgi:hypothetical protein
METAEDGSIAKSDRVCRKTASVCRRLHGKRAKVARILRVTASSGESVGHRGGNFAVIDRAGSRWATI